MISAESKNQVAELKKSNDSLADELKKSKVQVKNLEAAEKSNKVTNLIYIAFSHCSWVRSIVTFI